MVNDDGRDDGLAAPMPKLWHPEEAKPIEECLARVKRPLTEAELQRLAKMGRKDPEPDPEPTVLTGEELRIALNDADKKLADAGFREGSRPHRNRQ
jgi:hypothetical protein